MSARPIPRTLLVFSCLLVLAVPVGCGDGGGGNGQSAEDVARAYVAARNAGDAVKLCELYADELSKNVPGGDCRAFVTQQVRLDKKRSGTARTGFIRVDATGDQATAVLTLTQSGQTGQFSMPLTRQGGEWHIAGVNPITGY